MDRATVIKKIEEMPVKDYAQLGRLLPLDFFKRDTETVARELLGKIIVKREMEGYIAGRIVEVEAYFGENDPASHAYRGLTKRNEPMFLNGGHIYVYFCYGMHYMFNIVTETEGVPGAVLIRAAEPLAGLKKMYERRKTSSIYNLLSGPGKLAKAFDIDLRHNKTLLTPKNEIFLVEDEYFPDKILRKPRIGVPIIGDDNFRFVIAGSKFISKG